MSKKSVLAVISVIIVCLLAFLAVDGKARFPLLDRVLTTAIAPVNEKIVGLSSGANSIRTFFAAITTMQEENNKLKQDIEELRSANLKMAEIWAENQRLTNLLQYKNTAAHLNLLTAKVIGRDFGDAKDTLLINAGANAGLKENMAVINSAGLVGIIDETSPSVSRVLLITSPRCKVGGIVLRAQSRVSGVLSGVTSGEHILSMGNMSRDADIQSGDVIMTSGLGGNHPGGLVIGTVESVAMNIGGLLKQARITPIVDFTRLEEVMVITAYTNLTPPVANSATGGK
ncbi:MAG TPA: rod shape-determining protein MreC [Candidatus Avacidaminococcus intestinavium]|uniref:Cell shape-determining protein MreC n=1 Tax=Candidatus Avacidaminococcus intestinavium TaxID=2840684 RepID=A0A9D1SLG2_9FIRM|nr:rod shape-determining protein MreC [Candidatus Avacidaminococcus intestinavium]